MRILFYYAWSLDELGGAEVSTRTLAEGLLRRGHRVGIVETVERWSPQPRMHAFGGPVWSFPAAYLGRHPRSWYAVLRSLRRFRSILSQFKPDIVSVQCPEAQCVPVVLASVLPHTWRLVVTSRGWLEITDNHLVTPWRRRLCRRADAATAVSGSLWRDFVDRFPMVRHKGRVIYNGVGPAWFADEDGVGAANGAPYVLYVGRFSHEKGVDLLLRAWKHVQTFKPEVTLWMAGNGEAENDLRLLAKRLGIAARLRFLGQVSQLGLPSFYRNARLVVVPSRTEGLGRVALEAGACGAICVATRVGGLPEVIDDGVTGFLVKPESPEAMGEAIERVLLLSPEDRQRMSAAAKNRIQHHFTHDQTVAHYEELFRSLLNSGASTFGHGPR